MFFAFANIPKLDIFLAEKYKEQFDEYKKKLNDLFFLYINENLIKIKKQLNIKLFFILIT